ncbi:EAL domain, c-di-GMP-specific phosphodiesterase class I (or its enzymatically inactive variant) [Devosia lucknowensis]|uniref:EAL domain, c-di-GMP-specific phosphodiesterase class I (Or its enzymatically inactive variant) n=1 Tax=Devosia lucknowensis TaxID=1096929 RepID=A0A1Y6F784_9HYPH|nr:EAL domain-containing protein [Devosia lucknowensis]SMQ70266.1 EAL domain, c-di-GMP-specific phosphodiesterase class I (or its enzymatically inactive variant) [Devosia lucknowensis]
MWQLTRWLSAAMAMLVLLGLAYSGALASVDTRLSDWRLIASSVPATGSVVLVEIDSASLEEVGVWPWPRSLHADLLDRLMAAGVEDVAFDIDFSSSSTAFEDAQFTAALERAGGYARLAAFAQTDNTGVVRFSRPLPEFAAQAEPVLVNVLLDPVTARTRSLPVAASDAIGTVPALAVELARPQGELPPVLEIDFSIELAGIPRYSFVDVLYGRVDPARLAGRQVVVGASAIELRDFFNVPRYGVVPGPLLQVLAVETLKSGRILTNLGWLPGLAFTGLVALVLLLHRGRFNVAIIGLALLFCSALAEASALLAYSGAGILVRTAVLHTGLLMLFGLALADSGYAHLVARRAAQQRLKFLATHDPATGLLSRQGLVDLHAQQRTLILILLQVQALDELRATLGHDIVEQLLAQIAGRLMRTGYTHIARTAPANFALVAVDFDDAHRLAAAARDLASTLTDIYTVDSHTLHVDVLAGFAAGSADPSELLNQAEIALIHARSERLPARGFSRADQSALDRHRRLDSDLRQALSRDQLRLLFQPQVDLSDGRIVGVESLMRWEHPELGLVSPAEFIPLAEETGLIVELGRWILDRACSQAVAWPVPISVAVNVSPVQFLRSDLIASVEAALSRSGLPPERLDLEITESSRVTDPSRVHDVMWHLQKLGVHLSIDDFGTGYSALSHFRDLPFDMVKIDQGFVRDRKSESDRVLLAAIVELARKMGKQTLAEGVEDAETAAILRAMGCTFAQGYHFGRPLPEDALIALLLGQVEKQSA